MKRRTFLRLLRAAAVSVALATPVALLSEGSLAQTTRSIRLVIPYAAGGVNDAPTRLLADHIGRAGGPPLVIESRPGAGTVVATDAVSRAAPDGNTILLVGMGSFNINPQVRKLAYDPLTSFA